MKRTFLKSLAATALLANLPFVASAQGTRTVAQIASHEGADRHNMLLEGAKKEGELLVYYSHPIVQVMLDAFNKKYDLKGKGWRGGSEAGMQRITAEHKAGKYDWDIVLNPAHDCESLAREKLVVEVRSPGAVVGQRLAARYCFATARDVSGHSVPGLRGTGLRGCA